MTRRIAASWLAVGAFLMISARAAARRVRHPASQPAAATTMPTSTTDQTSRCCAGHPRPTQAGRGGQHVADSGRGGPILAAHDQYTAEVRKINDKRWAMMKDYAEHYHMMTDAQAKDHMEQSAAIDADLIALRMKYMPQFDALVPPLKVVQFYQIDRRLDLLLNLQLASLIPVVNPTK
jgi:hypothetical protein